MPTRLVREGIIHSDRINELDWAAEVFYRRLLNKVDDHGLYDARPSVLRTSLYPLKVDRVREADCSRWIAACEKAGLIVLYEAEGKPYLKVLDTRWQTRSEPKFPEPPLCTGESNRKQLQTPVTVVGDVVVVGDGVDVKGAHAPPAGFEIVWQTLPKRAGNNPKRRAEKAYRARVAEGCTPAEMLDGAGRYAKFCLATGKAGTEFVMQGATFLGPDKPFAQPWSLGNGGSRWDATNETILEKAKELGISTRGETSETLKAQIRERLAA